MLGMITAGSANAAVENTGRSSIDPTFLPPAVGAAPGLAPPPRYADAVVVDRRLGGVRGEHVLGIALAGHPVVVGAAEHAGHRVGPRRRLRGGGAATRDQTREVGDLRDGQPVGETLAPDVGLGVD